MTPAHRHSRRPVPGIHGGDYPELADADAAARGHAPFEWPGATRTALMQRVARVQAGARRWRRGTDAMLLAGRSAVEDALVRDAMGAEAVDAALAFAAEAARRVLGPTAYDCQLFAALAILDNRLVEMATGEGKSLAAALAAAVGALAGIPVHVLTANDYLVERDAEEFRPLFDFLGLSVAAVVGGQPPEERRAAYARPIVYVTAKELVFDYLRDRLLHGAQRGTLERRARALATTGHEQAPLLRGLCMAIVDEADSILIDEALMPLVLSRQVDGAAQRALYWQAHALAGRLVEGDDFICPPGAQRVELTPVGHASVELLSAHLQPVWKNRRHRDETIATALAARHVYTRDRDYLVVDGEVRIIDAVTGRTAAERKWSRGLHALVSLKEGCRVEPDLETLAQITFQRFFRRYVRFGGMSGTLAEARGELRRVYGAPVIRAALHRPSRREQWPSRCFVDDAARWDAVVARVRALRAAGRPALIGCDSVAASGALSKHLQAAGIPHAVLNARHDRHEAEIIARAGRSGEVTVATHMAGRGTDIHLDARALAAGGLHVIVCQRNPSRRHDRQLAGRAGRQGQPGSSECWASLETGPATQVGGLAAVLRRFAREGGVALPSALLDLLHETRQRFAEAGQTRRRRQLLASDAAIERGLAFCDFRE